MCIIRASGLQVDDQEPVEGNTALIEAARNGHTETVKELLKHGATIGLANQMQQMQNLQQQMQQLQQVQHVFERQLKSEPGAQTPAGVTQHALTMPGDLYYTMQDQDLRREVMRRGLIPNTNSRLDMITVLIDSDKNGGGQQGLTGSASNMSLGSAAAYR